MPTVGGELQSIGMAEARNALAWWLEAGVDVAVQEEPATGSPGSSAPQAAEPAPPNVVEPSHETLLALQEWLASGAQLPLASATARRILPHGPEKAAVMLLSDAPSLEDFAAGQPIGGGLGTDQTDAGRDRYPPTMPTARRCPVFIRRAQMSAAEREACAEIARKHIALASPKRLLLLGDGPCAGAARQAARPGPRPCLQDRGRAHGRDLPSRAS